MKLINKIKNKFNKNTNTNVVKAKTWNDITLGTYMQIVEILQSKKDDTDKTFDLVDCIYNIDSKELPIQELNQYSISFISEEMKNVEIKKEYVINGREYVLGSDLTVVSVAQFIDYNEYIKNGSKFNEILSIFFIPKGMKYGDGYDVKQVQKDLLDLPMPIVKTLAFFFAIQLTLFVNLFLQSLKEDLTKMEVKDMEKKQELIKILEGLDFPNLV